MARGLDLTNIFTKVASELKIYPIGKTKDCLPPYKNQDLHMQLWIFKGTVFISSLFSKRLSLLLDMHKKPTLYREIRDKKQKIEEKTGKKEIGTFKKEKEEW